MLSQNMCEASSLGWCPPVKLGWKKAKLQGNGVIDLHEDKQTHLHTHMHIYIAFPTILIYSESPAKMLTLISQPVTRYKHKGTYLNFHSQPYL